MIASRNLYLSFLLLIVIYICFQISDGQFVAHHLTISGCSTATDYSISQKGHPTLQNALQGILKKAVLPITCQFKNPENQTSISGLQEKYTVTEHALQPSVYIHDSIYKNILCMRCSGTSYLHLLQKLII